CGWAVGQQKLARAIRVTQLPLLLKYCCASTAVRPAGQLELAAEGSTSREEKSPNRVLVEVDEPVRRSDRADGGTRLIIMADRWPRCIAAAHRPGRLLAPHRRVPPGVALITVVVSSRLVAEPGGELGQADAAGQGGGERGGLAAV